MNNKKIAIQGGVSFLLALASVACTFLPVPSIIGSLFWLASVLLLLWVVAQVFFHVGQAQGREEARDERGENGDGFGPLV